MKAERRHELQTNELSVQLKRASEFLQQHGSTILIAGVIVICLISAVAYSSHSASEARAEGWASFFSPVPRADGATESEIVDGTIAHWSNLIQSASDDTLRDQARIRLIDYCVKQLPLSSGGDETTKLLDTAEQGSNTLLADAGRNIVLKAAALNWLSLIEQNRFNQDLDDSRKQRARAYLEQIRDGKEFTGTPFQTDALEQLNRFESLWEPLTLAEPEPPAEEPEVSTDASPAADEGGAEAISPEAAAPEGDSVTPETETPAPADGSGG